MSKNRSEKKWSTNMVFVPIFLFILVSCDFVPRGRCEAFNMKRIPYNFDYYNRSLLYVSGEDSILFKVVETYTSKGHKLGGLAVDCSPNFDITRSCKERRMKMGHYFGYSLNEGDDPKTTLYITFNSSRIEFPVDSMVSVCKTGIQVEITKFNNVGYDKNQFIRRAKFQNMFFTELEEYSGKIWRLAKVGDSIVEQ